MKMIIIKVMEIKEKEVKDFALTKEKKDKIKKTLKTIKLEAEKISPKTATKANFISAMKDSRFKEHKEALAYGLECIEKLYPKKKKVKDELQYKPYIQH